MKDTPVQFTYGTVVLHWLVAAGMLYMLWLGLSFDWMEEGPELYDAILLHKSIGVLILALGSARVLWRLYNGMPKPVGDHAAWEKILAKIIHWILLLSVLGMPISGILMSRGAGYPVAVFGFEVMAAVPKNKALMDTAHMVHEYLALVVIGSFVLHFAGAVKHTLIDRDGTLSRMLGKKV